MKEVSQMNCKNCGQPIVPCPIAMELHGLCGYKGYIHDVIYGMSHYCSADVDTVAEP